MNRRLLLTLGGLLVLAGWLQGVGAYRGWDWLRGKIVRVSRTKSEATVAQLQGQLAQVQEENAQLRKLLQLPNKGWRLSVTANCLYRNGLQPQSDLWFDRGQRDGVSLRTVALHSGGLVGRVVEVTPTRCRVRPLLSSQVRVPVALHKVGLQGVAHGKGWLIELEQVRARPQVEPGTWVVTSGLGEVYPGSILVGRVRRPLTSVEPMFARYEVEPSVLVDQVLEVLLVEREQAP